MPGQTPEADDTFLTLVDFKWLMAGWGWWVDLTRLQRDAAYADACVQLGLASGCELLRKRSAELLPRARPACRRPEVHRYRTELHGNLH